MRPRHAHRDTGRPEVPGLAARRVAAKAVAAVLQSGTPLEEALDPERLDTRDLALARMIAATTMRRFGSIGRVLDGFLDKGLPNTGSRLDAILATAAAQILFLDAADHAAVDIAVRLAQADARTGGFAGLTNAVLRRVVAGKADAVASLADDADTPAWLARRWRAAWGDTAGAIMRAHRAEPPLDLTPRGDGADVAAQVRGRLLPTGSVRLAQSGLVSGLPGYEAGDWWVQDAAAVLPARLLGDVRGRRVLDLCAAPGGKTAQLAAAGAIVTAVDRAPDRLTRLKQNLKRLKLSADVVAADVLSFRSEPADAVLLDAPCSATGTVRRHPDIAWAKSEDDIVALADLQRRLLDRAADLVKPGGLLVFCTCSIEQDEGERQAEAFSGRNARFERVPVTAAEVGGLAEAVTATGDLRTLPSMLFELGGLDGFFAARFRRLS